MGAGGDQGKSEVGSQGFHFVLAYSVANVRVVICEGSRLQGLECLFS